MRLPIAPLVLAAACPATAQVAPLAPNEVLLQLVETGTVRTAATRTVLTAQIRTSGDTVPLARAANIALFDKVIAAVQRAGAPASAVRVLPPARQLGFVGNEIDPNEMAEAVAQAGPRPKPSVTNTIQIQLPNPGLYVPVRDALEGSGATRVGTPTYELSDDRAARAAARASALRQAQDGAKSYADALNMRVARIVRVASGRPNGDMTTIMDNYPATLRQMMGLDDSLVEGQVVSNETVTVEFALAPK